MSSGSALGRRTMDSRPPFGSRCPFTNRNIRHGDPMKVLAMVLAGGAGTRLYPLTAEHAKPAVPFAYGFRIVDFVLSNLVNSKISSIYLLAQYKPRSLIKHIESAWGPWSHGPGTIEVLLPRPDKFGGRFRGTADAVFQNIDVIRRHAPDLVAVFAADHIYRMDVRQMIAFHDERRADVTVAAVPVPIAAATAFGVITADADGAIVEFQEKPATPSPTPGDASRAFASMGNYLFNPGVLIELLEESARREGADFGLDIMPRLPDCARTYAYDFMKNRLPGVEDYEETGYWRDVGTLEALAAARTDAFGSRPRFNIWNRRWPIRGEGHATLVSHLREWKDRPAVGNNGLSAPYRVASSPQDRQPRELSR
jgi:glucose-1-phosphate adenylyltransferase